jgi:phage portal protein BeeE
LTGGLKYRAVNPSQKEMDFVESRRFNRDEIL